MTSEETCKKKIVIDLDDTISITHKGDYDNSIPINNVVDKLREYKDKGYDIVVYSSRNMRTYNNNIGEINVHTLPKIITFLHKYNIPYDQIFLGKPWAGFDGFYVDDKCIRPSEFINLSENEINDLLKKEKSNLLNAE